MSTDATQKGVSKPDENEEENKAAVADVLKSTHKEANDERTELVEQQRAQRDAEMVSSGQEVVDTGGDPDDGSDKEKQEKIEPNKDGDDKNKNSAKEIVKDSDTKNVDNAEDFDTLTVDGKETQVSKSKIYDAGKRAMQKESTADTRLEEATIILNEAKATAKQITESSQLSSSQTDVDDTASKIDKEALAKVLVDGDVEQVAEAIGTIMGTGRQEELATQAVKMQPDDVYSMVEGALQMKDAMDLFQEDPESGGYSDLYSDETMRQMVFDKEAELAKVEKPEAPANRLKQAAESVRNWRNGLIEQSGGKVVDFGERSSKKANAESTASSVGGRKPAEKNEQPKSEADKRREALGKMARSRGQHLD